MSNVNEIDAEHILFSNDETEPEMFNKELSLDEHTRRIIKAYLNKYNGNVKKAAEKLDIGFSTIYRMMRKEKQVE
jgi:transcriptional regulator with PAS, ATPase and Fis domain